MTIFMSPKTAYRLGRYGEHSVMAWILTVILLIGFGTAASAFVSEENKALRSRASVVLVLGGLGLFSRNGRRTVGRISRECFYGTLGSFTGVCGCDSKGVIGDGSYEEGS